MTVTAVLVAVKRRYRPKIYSHKRRCVRTCIYNNRGEEYTGFDVVRGGVRSRLFTIIDIFTVYKTADLWNIFIAIHNIICLETHPHTS